MWFQSSKRSSRDYTVDTSRPSPRIHQRARPSSSSQHQHQDSPRRRHEVPPAKEAPIYDDYPPLPRRKTKHRRYDDHRRETDPCLPLPRAHQRPYTRPNHDHPRNTWINNDVPYTYPTEPPPPYVEYPYTPQCHHHHRSASANPRASYASHVAKSCSDQLCLRDALGGTEYCEFHILEHSGVLREEMEEEEKEEEKEVRPVHVHVTVHVHHGPSYRVRPTSFATYSMRRAPF